MTTQEPQEEELTPKEAMILRALIAVPIVLCLLVGYGFAIKHNYDRENGKLPYQIDSAVRADVYQTVEAIDEWVTLNQKGDGYYPQWVREYAGIPDYRLPSLSEMGMTPSEGTVITIRESATGYCVHGVNPKGDVSKETPIGYYEDHQSWENNIYGNKLNERYLNVGLSALKIENNVDCNTLIPESELLK